MVSAVRQASGQACLEPACMNGTFTGTTTPVTTPDGCTTWSGNVNGWTVTHGAPELVTNGYLPTATGFLKGLNCVAASGVHLLHEYGGNPDYPNFNGGSGIKVKYDFVVGQSYDIRILYRYECPYYDIPSLPEEGWLEVVAPAIASTGDLAACREAIPNAGGVTIAAIPLPANPGLAYDVSMTYTPTTPSELLWVYPIGYNYRPGQDANPEVDIFLSNIFVCPSCPSGTVYINSGTVPLSENVGTIYAGTNTIDHGSGIGTVTNQPAQVSTLTAGNFIELNTGFTATASGSGSLNLNIAPCYSVANGPRPDINDSTTIMAGDPVYQTVTTEEKPALQQMTNTALTADTATSPTKASPITDSLATATASGLVVYPTVNNGSFTISGGPADLNNAEILIIDRTGQILYNRFNESATSITVNLNNLSNGLYVVEVRQSGKITTKKIIVSR